MPLGVAAPRSLNHIATVVGDMRKAEGITGLSAIGAAGNRHHALAGQIRLR